MGLLDGDLAQSIYDGFRGRLLTGTYRQRATPLSGALDGAGDPLDLGTTNTPFEGFTDDYSAFYRAQAGIPETDLKLCIFAKSMPGVVPKAGDIVQLPLSGPWYQVRKRRVDPAGALWVCQSFEIPEPGA